jgi:hypothetical protein
MVCIMTDSEIRMSGPTLRVLKVFLERPRLPLAGAELMKSARVGSGTLYPMLYRLEEAGWLQANWEEIDPRKAGRPKQRFYKLTGLGQRLALGQFASLNLISGAPIWNM